MMKLFCFKNWILSYYNFACFQLFPRFPIQKIRLFDDYDELREKFSTEAENGQLFQSLREKAEALKLLEDILRYTELALFEVKKEELLRRSDRNYIFWADGQRSQLFAKIPALKVSRFLYLLLFQSIQQYQPKFYQR